MPKRLVHGLFGRSWLFGEDVSEQLEYVPESFKVIRHVRPKFACAACERVVEAPTPSRPI
jgi:transposase